MTDVLLRSTEVKPKTRFGCRTRLRPRQRRQHRSRTVMVGLMALASSSCSLIDTTLALHSPRRNPNHRAIRTQRRMVLTTPEAIIEQASTTKLLDDLIDESVRTSARRPFILQFDPSSGWIWKRWKGTVFSETWDSCVYRMLWAGIVYVGLSRQFPQAKEVLSGFNIFWGQLLSVTTFTLTFFVNQSYALWRKCSELSRRLQGRLHDLDMTLAAHAVRKQPTNPAEPSVYTAGSRQVLELVSRYVRLFNLLTYASFTRSHRPILTPRGMRRLVERGLMTPLEREVLVEAEIPATQRHNAVLLWIVRSFIEGKEAGHLVGDAGFEQQFIEKAHVARSAYGAIGDELQGRMPLAYAHIVQVLVDMVLWMYPVMAFSAGMSIYVCILGQGILTIGYQGLFDLAKQFLDPYDNDNQGKGEDPLVIDTLIAETNAGSVRWLNGLAQMPISAQRFKNAELSDSLLPIRGYTVEELKEMQEEKRVLQAKREKEELERKRIEAYELRVREAADAMIPALLDAGRRGLPGGGAEASDASYGIIFNNTGDRIGLPGGLVSPNFPVVEEVANNLLYSQNVNSTSLQRELIPKGTAPASAYVEEISVVEEEEEEPLEMEEPPPEETKERERIMFGGASFDEEEDDAFEVIEDWGTDTSYVHKFDAFDPYLDLPSLDEVGPDGEEIRFSQILANEQWDEEIEYETEKDKVRSYAEYVERVVALKDAEARELQETEEILSASADSRERGDLDTKADSERAKPYDQTKLDGVSQLFGLPPDVLSEIPGYEEPEAPDSPEFATIDQLWGDTGLSSSLSSEPSQTPSISGNGTFDGISQLWGEKIEDEGDLSSATRTGLAPQEDGQDGYPRREADGLRLSEMLADEVYGSEELPAEHPFTYEDYEKQVQEILEAEREELLETEAIMNAPPGAQDISVPEINDGNDKETPQEVADDLAVLEMDAEMENDTACEKIDAAGDVVVEEDHADGEALAALSLSSAGKNTDDSDMLDEPNGDASSDAEIDNRPSL